MVKFIPYRTHVRIKGGIIMQQFNNLQKVIDKYIEANKNLNIEQQKKLKEVLEKETQEFNLSEL